MLVPEEDLVKAVTWGATIFQIANFAGPLVGGLLFSLHRIIPKLWAGGPLVYGFTLVTICSFLLLVRSMRIDARGSQDILREGFAPFAGFRFILAEHSLLRPILLDLLVAIFGGAVALMPVFATDVLHTGAAGLGLLRCAPGAGALLVSVARLSRRNPQCTDGNLLLWMTTFSMATIVFAWSRWMWLSIIMLALVGASQMMSLLIRTSLTQQAHPRACAAV
jgi:hypothetical protein